MDIVLRKARPKDLDKLIEVESKSTPKLRYLPYVFEMFVKDAIGEFSVAELDGEVVACGKFTLLPDGSAWLEALRVAPERQGLGIGKRFYEHFYDIACENGVTDMRMYTSVGNVVSRRLAERFGFRVAGTYRGAWLASRQGSTMSPTGSFRKVTDPDRANALLTPYHEKWTGFLVMNRTFYRMTPALWTDLTRKGFVFEDPISRSVIVLGARFMPEQGLHIGVFGGDVKTCLGFAMQRGAKQMVQRLSCLYPPSEYDVQYALLQHGFQIEESDFIVMQVTTQNFISSAHHRHSGK